MNNSKAFQVTQWQRIHLPSRRRKRLSFDPWVRKIPWRRKCQLTPVFLLGKSQTEEFGGLQSVGSQRVRHDWAAAAAAKSLQSCPTLCDPIDSSPPGSAVPGILQARILEWVAISFSTWLSMHAQRAGNMMVRNRLWSQTAQLFCCFFNSFLIHLFILVVLGLRCFAWTSSRCSEWVYSSLWCTGFSSQWLLLLQNTDSRHMGFCSCSTRAQ